MSWLALAERSALKQLTGNVEDSAFICEGNNAAVFQHAHVTNTTRYLREYRLIVDHHITVELKPSDFFVDQRTQ